MSTLKSLTIVAVLLAGGTSLAMAQNAITRYLDMRYLEMPDAQPVAQPGYVGRASPSRQYAICQDWINNGRRIYPRTEPAPAVVHHTKFRQRMSALGHSVAMGQ